VADARTGAGILTPVIRRRLGRSDLEVSVIAFGCMSLGEDHAENARLIHAALDRGINLFDTADLYQHGENEVTVGRALRGRRRDAIIATKVGNQWRPDGSGWDWNPRKAYIKEAVVGSLKRLETDCIDLYQLHGGTIDDPMDETMEAFEELRQAGAIRHYGISSIRPNVIAEWVERSRMTSVMMQYSLLDRRPEEECLGLVGRSDVGVLVRGGLAKGLLASKPPAEYLDHEAGAVRRVQGLLAEVTEPGTTPGQTALRFGLTHPAVTTVVCGIRTLAQLEENAAAGEQPPLGGEVLDRLRTEVPASVYTSHRRGPA
jgi:aryl-alcohol dehydrogenase-like predicted oxidoreductase